MSAYKGGAYISQDAFLFWLVSATVVLQEHHVLPFPTHKF